MMITPDRSLPGQAGVAPSMPEAKGRHDTTTVSSHDPIEQQSDLLQQFEDLMEQVLHHLEHDHSFFEGRSCSWEDSSNER